MYLNWKQCMWTWKSANTWKILVPGLFLFKITKQCNVRPSLKWFFLSWRNLKWQKYSMENLKRHLILDFFTSKGIPISDLKNGYYLPFQVLPIQKKMASVLDLCFIKIRFKCHLTQAKTPSGNSLININVRLIRFIVLFLMPYPCSHFHLISILVTKEKRLGSPLLFYI